MASTIASRARAALNAGQKENVNSRGIARLKSVDGAVPSRKPADSSVISRPTTRQALRNVGNRTNSLNLGSKAALDDQKVKITAGDTNEVRLTRRPLHTQADNAAGGGDSVNDEKSKITTAHQAKPPLGRRPLNVAVTNRNKQTNTFQTKRSTVVTRAASVGDVGSSKVAPSLKRSTTLLDKDSVNELSHQVVKPPAVVYQTLKVETVTQDVSMVSAKDLDVTSENVPMETSSSDAFSNVIAPPLEFTDIDDMDKENPLVVADYAVDIYKYLRFLEDKYFIRDDFLDADGSSQDIKPHMRGILVDWMFQVHIRFSLLAESMQMAVGLLDRFLQVSPVKKNELQLVGVTSLFIASKYEEIYSPEIGDFVYITDNTYSKERIRKMERKMLRDLQFDLGRPLPIHFLRRYSKAADGDAFHHTVAKYLVDLSMIDYQLACVKPSLVAAAATHMTRVICYGDDTEQGEWNSTLHYYTQYSTEQMQSTIKMIARRLLKTYRDENKLMAVRNKYSSNKMLNVGTFGSLKSQLILDWASLG